MSWRARTCDRTGIGAGSTFREPLLTVAVGLVVTGESTAVATAEVWPWLGVWASGAAGTSGGIGASRSGARKGAVVHS